MRFFMITTLMLVVLFYVTSIFLPKKEKQEYSDDELRRVALSRNMSSMPSTYDELLRLVDTKENRLSREKIELGRDLYFDTILSKNRDVSCASCHMITKSLDSETIFSDAISSKIDTKNDCVVCHLGDQSGVDRLSSAVGSGGVEDRFHLNTQSILNSALAKYLTWDGSVKSVEQEAGRSIIDPYKMDLSRDEALRRVRGSEEYLKRFEVVFKDSERAVSFENIQKAIGGYVRTILTRGDYDRFLDGNSSAMSAKAKRGLANFINFGCKGCHTGVTVGGQSIQKFPVRDYNSIVSITYYFNEQNSREVGTMEFNFEAHHSFPFDNLGGFMGRDDKQLFRVPTLRNVTKTSPYFHNGSVGKIGEAVAIMAKYQLGMSLTDTQTDEIVAFLKSLEGDRVDYQIMDEVK